jgi:hypothetical protein
VGHAVVHPAIKFLFWVSLPSTWETGQGIRHTDPPLSVPPWVGQFKPKLTFIKKIETNARDRGYHHGHVAPLRGS